jgi:hypothetical protein
VGPKKAGDLLVVLLDGHEMQLKLADKRQQKGALGAGYGWAGLELRGVQLGFRTKLVR